jgi:predicted protein tyrosine phosphatase
MHEQQRLLSLLQVAQAGIKKLKSRQQAMTLQMEDMALKQTGLSHT